MGKIGRELIASTFTELRKKRVVFVVLGNEMNFYMAAIPLGFVNIILVDKEIFNFTDVAIRGCIAHELAHLLGRKEERKADELVLEKGLGDELLQFHREHEKRFERYNASEGYTRKEIKEYLKKNRNH